MGVLTSALPCRWTDLFCGRICGAGSLRVGKHLYHTFPGRQSQCTDRQGMRVIRQLGCDSRANGRSCEGVTLAQWMIFGVATGTNRKPDVIFHMSIHNLRIE